jgi:four helix bundle protein
MQDFKDLTVWQKAYHLSLLSYQFTSTFPSSEQFGLTNQIRRCAVSITANIAEGRGRGSDADFKRFIQISIGSICELECHFMLANDLKFLKDNDFDTMIENLTEIRKMLIALRQRLQSS